ncbi:hypothetical protein HJG60_009504 [Phyllostomus discolor]|uniref:Secreted protein n=1 Tax=Phyllostomus discolor TaxID=89673 RepID=A0A833YLF7_9CHIR|nr:hypothetical protein HJG60_009504 [Phyllostomus discolor]
MTLFLIRCLCFLDAVCLMSTEPSWDLAEPCFASSSAPAPLVFRATDCLLHALLSSLAVSAAALSISFSSFLLAFENIFGLHQCCLKSRNKKMVASEKAQEPGGKSQNFIKIAHWKWLGIARRSLIASLKNCFSSRENLPFSW